MEAATDFAPESLWAEQLRSARAALAEVAQRFTTLLRSAKRPEAPAVGTWRVSDVAAHVSHVSAADLMVARTVGDPVGEGLRFGEDIIVAAEALNAFSLEGDRERDLKVLAARIEHNVGAFLETTAEMSGSEPVAWLSGLVLPSAGPACHFLEELLVHGYDIARAEGRPWPIAPDHAALGFGFVIDVLRFSSPNMRRFFVDQDAAEGLRACFDFRMRGARRDFFVFDDGLVTIENPSDRHVDCHISADPVAALLTGMGRIGQARSALTGRMAAWGRRPWLAFKLSKVLKNP